MLVGVRLFLWCSWAGKSPVVDAVILAKTCFCPISNWHELYRQKLLFASITVSTLAGFWRCRDSSSVFKYRQGLWVQWDPHRYYPSHTHSPASQPRADSLQSCVVTYICAKWVSNATGLMHKLCTGLKDGWKVQGAGASCPSLSLSLPTCIVILICLRESWWESTFYDFPTLQSWSKDLSLSMVGVSKMLVTKP